MITHSITNPIQSSEIWHPTLARVPNDMWGRICDYFDHPKGPVDLSLTCRRLYSLIQDHDMVWGAFIQKHFPHSYAQFIQNNDAVWRAHMQKHSPDVYTQLNQETKSLDFYKNLVITSHNINSKNYLFSTFPNLRVQKVLDGAGKIFLGLTAGVSENSRDQTIKIWDPTNNTIKENFQESIYDIVSFIFHDHMLISGSYNEIYVWDIREKKKVLEIGTEKTNCSLAVYGDFLISGSSEGMITIWDFKSGKEKNTFQGHTDVVNHLIVYKDMLISGSHDGQIKVWNLKNDKELLIKQLLVFQTKLDPIIGTRSLITGILINEGQLISSLWTGVIEIWNLQDGSRLQELKEEKRVDSRKETRFTSIALYKDQLICAVEIHNPDDKSMVGLNYGIQIWDLKNAQPLHTLCQDNGDLINSMVIFRGKLIASTERGNIEVWDFSSNAVSNK